MSLHVRYADCLQHDRAVVFFEREDLLLRGELAGVAVPLVASPGDARRLVLVGPTILDLLMRRELDGEDQAASASGQSTGAAAAAGGAVLGSPGAARAVWSLRPPADFLERRAKRSELHPFKLGLVSGGTPADPRPDDDGLSFVRVVKRSSVSLSAYTFRLAVAALGGGVADAYATIAAKAAAAWLADLQRSLALYAAVLAAPGQQLAETPEIARLRPAGSVSDAIETDILREACMLLGVPPDLDIRRPRGRPRRAAAGDVEAGDFISVQLVDGEVTAKTIAPINGIPAQTDLSTLTLLKLLKLLGVLQEGGAEADADLLEAYLDAAAPEWRDGGAADDEEPGAASDDPYAILGVTPAMTMEEITKAYRRAMQAIHPDKGACSAWFSQVAAAAYRRIKDQRGSEEA